MAAKTRLPDWARDVTSMIQDKEPSTSARGQKKTYGPWARRSLAILLGFSLFQTCATSETTTGSENHHHEHTTFAFHREGQTRMDGARCPLYPTCGWWGEGALDHGIAGFLLLIDRLVYRERGGIETHYTPVPARMSRDLRYYDPLEDTFPLLETRRPSLLKEDFSQ